MVQITPFLVASLGLLSGVANALPRPDSSINEPAVSAPNGTPITDTSAPQATSSSSSDMSSDSSMSSDMGSDMSSDMSSSSYGSSDSSSSSWSSGSDSSSNSGSSYGGSNSDNSWSSSVVTSTSTAWSSYSTPSYGSGSSNWDSSGYNDCVSQCMANFGGLPSSYTPSSTSGSSDSSSSGSGATHTVIVAPTQGVLRYIPFALNASVGDTIQFMWGADKHTVTRSSELTPCNKTYDTPFSSGEQNKGFMFTQVVNDTNPLFFYCGTPTHCQKGMFGIINPPNAAGAPSSVSGMMQSIAANSSDVMGYAAFTKKSTAGNTVAATWGSNIDLASLPAWSHEFVAENVLYTRNFLAANTDVLQDDGSVNLGAAGSNPLMIPQDLAAALSNASPATTGAPAAATTPAANAANTPATTGSAAAASDTGAPANSGALSISSSKVVVGLVAAFATFMMM